jgi:hypothetical protein
LEKKEKINGKKKRKKGKGKKKKKWKKKLKKKKKSTVNYYCNAHSEFPVPLAYNFISIIKKQKVISVFFNQ